MPLECNTIYLLLYTRLVIVGENGEIELNQVMKDFGFPLEHRHKLVCLRQELIEAFIE